MQAADLLRCGESPAESVESGMNRNTFFTSVRSRVSFFVSFLLHSRLIDNDREGKTIDER